MLAEKVGPPLDLSFWMAREQRPHWEVVIVTGLESVKGSAVTEAGCIQLFAGLHGVCVTVVEEILPGLARMARHWAHVAAPDGQVLLGAEPWEGAAKLLLVPASFSFVDLTEEEGLLVALEDGPEALATEEEKVCLRVHRRLPAILQASSVIWRYFPERRRASRF